MQDTGLRGGCARDTGHTRVAAAAHELQGSQGHRKAGVEKGGQKARLSWDKALLAGFLVGAYIAFGSLLAITVSAGLNPDVWGGLSTFFTGAVFSLDLILVLLAGSELLTGNIALVRSRSSAAARRSRT